MMNLAGHVNPNFTIERELTRCRIEVVRGETSQGEVATSLTGRLGPYTFCRAWCYWVVEGRVPLAVADELYADPVGREDVRVGGDCGCPDPRDGQADWFDDEGFQLIPASEQPEWDRLCERSSSIREEAKRLRFVDDPTRGNGFIETYHIDSEIGLRVFADAIRRHGLDGGGEQP